MANLNCSSEKPYVEVSSYIGGVHVYDRSLKLKVGDILQLQRESDDCEDKFAVAVCEQSQLKGHIPNCLSCLFLEFLQRDFSEGETEVTGERVNRGAGYRVEV